MKSGCWLDSFPAISGRLWVTRSNPLLVIPAQAGTQWLRFPVFAPKQMFDDARDNRPQSHWVPACAGMTIGKTEGIRAAFWCGRGRSNKGLLALNQQPKRQKRTDWDQLIAHQVRSHQR
jgi:hypothetical protein